MTENGHEICLGLDVSTSCVGVCLYEDTGEEYGKILDLTHVKLKNDKRIKGLEELFVKGKSFERFIKGKYEGITIDRIVIEEPLLTSNNAYTVETLIRFNTIVANSMYSMFGVVPELISSYEARLFSFPELVSVRKINKQDKVYDRNTILKALKKSHVCLFGDFKFDIDKKTVMMECVNKVYDIDWSVNRNDNIRKENYDSCDALVCILGYYRRLIYNGTSPKVTSYTESVDKVDYVVEFCNKKYRHTLYFN